MFNRLAALLTLTAIAFSLFFARPAAAQIRTIDNYNGSLIKHGISWKEGGVVYHPSFYTGFAPRVEDPNRIHFHVSRGNQARLTATLDEMTILTYLYGLKKRSDVFTSMTNSRTILPIQHKLVDMYHSIIKSDAYRILPLTSAYDRGQLSREELYEASLGILKALNPGRVFALRFDMRGQTLSWRDRDLRTLGDRARLAGAVDAAAVKAFLAKNPRESIVATNNLLFGRINAIALSDAQLAKLADLVVSATLAPIADEALVEKAMDYFTDVTEKRYDFRVVVNRQYRKALECSVASCDLVYHELTAIYPNGSVREMVRDREGNRVAKIQENGVMKFVERSYGDVDHIRVEPFYGFIPKMDYTDSGNGIHNPAVRTYLKSSKYKSLYDVLGIPKTDSTLWIVSRGLVSHGCTRLATGHLLEARDIFPSNPREMPKVKYTGNLSTDYDLFDIDGSGRLRVMGVDYLIAYNIVADFGEGYREGNGLLSQSFKKPEFYELIYGKRQYVVSNGSYVFPNPYISYFANAKPGAKRASAFSVRMSGDFPLYEQAYEKDKVQFFDIPRLGVGSLETDSNDRMNESHQLVRLFGRIAGCGPFAREFSRCHEMKFEQEMSSILSKIR